MVKTGDRILGPFSTDELKTLIREKEVVAIDEIMRPRGRWGYLRDEAVFVSTVEDVRRGQMHAQENTEIQGYTGSVTTPSTSETITEVPIPAVTKPAMSVVPKASSASARVDLGAEAQAFSDQLGPATKSVMTPRDRSKIIVPDEEPPTRKRVRPGMFVGSLVIVCAIGYIFYSVMNKPGASTEVTTTQTAASADSEKQASMAWKRGEFDRALELYRSLDRAQPGQPFIAARLATLMLKLEGQTVEAKRVIESAQPNANDADSKAALAMASGLAALQGDDPKEAAVQFAQAGSSWVTSFDAGVAFALQKNWNEAVHSFEKAGTQTVSQVMLARTHLMAGDEPGMSPSIKSAARARADSALKKASSLSPDFQQESLLLEAYTNLISNQTKRAGAKVLEAIEIDPNQTADHFHDPGLSLDQVSWAKFLNYCRALHSTLNSRSSAALLGICLAKSSQLEDANHLIEQEVSRDPSNAVLHSVNAYLQILGGRDDAARASLGLAVKNGNTRLAQILSARLCAREGQDTCAEEGWSKLAAGANPPIAALTGLAQVRLAKGDSATANALMVKADSISPAYLPLLRMREEASR